MLVKLAIDPDAGTELGEGSDPPGRALVRFLRERCLLVVDAESSGASLARGFAQSGSSELVQALGLLIQNRLRIAPDPAPVPVDCIESEQDLRSWDGAAELLLLANFRAEVLRTAAQTGSPEISNLREALNSTVVDVSNELWDGYLRPGEHRDEVWRVRLLPFASNSRRLCIVDRYLALHMVRRLLDGADTHPARGGEWFLSTASRSGLSRISVVSSARELPKSLCSPGEAQAALQDWFDALGSAVRLDVHVVDGNFDHGRRIAFDGWVGFELHNGLASFDKPRLVEGMGLVASPRLGPEVFRHFRDLVRVGGGLGPAQEG